jgi:hypothetical protein
MDAIEYRAALKALGLSQSTAGPWLGISRRQAERYASAYQQVPMPVAKLIRLVVRLGLTADEVSPHDAARPVRKSHP